MLLDGQMLKSIILTSNVQQSVFYQKSDIVLYEKRSLAYFCWFCLYMRGDYEASFSTVLSKEDEWGPNAPREKASPPVDSLLIYMRHKFTFKWQKIARVADMQEHMKL